LNFALSCCTLLDSAFAPVLIQVGTASTTFAEEFDFTSKGVMTAAADSAGALGAVLQQCC
jgi:hypothetical protein